MIQDTHIFKEPEAQYHARDAITSHRLIDFSRNPFAYSMAKAGHPLYARSPSQGMSLGSLVHLMLLEPERLGEVATGGPTNPKTNKPYGPTSDKYLEWASEQEKAGKIVVSDDDLAKANAMRESVLASEWELESPWTGLGLDDGIASEMTVLGRIGDVFAQCKPDIWDAANCVCWDLKTTSKFDGFSYDCRDYGYYIQAAWYSTMLKSLTGVAPSWRWIVVENVKPYRVKVVVAPNRIEQAMTELPDLVSRFLDAKATGTYSRPTVTMHTID